MELPITYHGGGVKEQFQAVPRACDERGEVALLQAVPGVPKSTVWRLHPHPVIGGAPAHVLQRQGHVRRDARLPDAKTGGRVVPLGPEARAVLSAIPRDDDNPWVIAGRLPGSHLTDLQRPWRRIRKQAGLEDVRIHDLRHSFASRALALGESLTMIGKLLGHTQVQTTARYAHLARDSIQTAAARITGSIGGNLTPDGTRAVHDAEE